MHIKTINKLNIHPVLPDNHIINKADINFNSRQVKQNPNKNKKISKRAKKQLF